MFHNVSYKSDSVVIRFFDDYFLKSYPFFIWSFTESESPRSSFGLFQFYVGRI